MSRKATAVLKTQDFLAGLMFTGIGLLGLYLSLQHEVGAAARMGPGFFPALVAGGLILIGLAILAKAVFGVSPRFKSIEWRPFLFIIGATLFFALAVDRIGLLLSVAILAVFCRLAESPFEAKEVVLLAVGMTALSVTIFYYGLGLPFKILP